MHVASMLDQMTISQTVPGRSCGSCGLCCKVYDVPEVPKTAGSWCKNWAAARGCAVHADRPGQCRAFFCMWMTQAFLGPEWKPEKSRFVLTMDAQTRWLFAQVDPGAPQAWRKDPYLGQFRRWAAAGARPVIVFVNRMATAVLGDREIPLGTLGPDDRLALRTEAGSGRLTVDKFSVAG